MSTATTNRTAYMQNNGPLYNIQQAPIISNRNPTVNDKAALGTVWVNKLLALVFIAAQNVANAETWLQVESSGGVGTFTSLTVTPGPTAITGTTTINNSGAGVTTIGTGGTGAVNIGNATGNTAVTGSLSTTTSLTATTTVTAGTGITSTTGAITATAGAIVAGTILRASGDAAGVASTNSLSNVVVNAAGGGTVTFGANGAGNITQDGWIKVYVGTTAAYIPYFISVA
jgi:hypothetical protein